MKGGIAAGGGCNLVCVHSDNFVTAAAFDTLCVDTWANATPRLLVFCGYAACKCCDSSLMGSCNASRDTGAFVC